VESGFCLRKICNILVDAIYETAREQEREKVGTEAKEGDHPGQLRTAPSFSARGGSRLHTTNTTHCASSLTTSSHTNTRKALSSQSVLSCSTVLFWRSLEGPDSLAAQITPVSLLSFSLALSPSSPRPEEGRTGEWERRGGKS
jgi:hypothetical protein